TSSPIVWCAAFTNAEKLGDPPEGSGAPGGPPSLTLTPKLHDAIRLLQQSRHAVVEMIRADLRADESEARLELGSGPESESESKSGSGSRSGSGLLGLARGGAQVGAEQRAWLLRIAIRNVRELQAKKM